MSADSGVVLRPTPRYHRVFGRADEIARAAGSSGVGTGHLLLAIIREGQSVPAQALAHLVDLDQAEAAVAGVLNSPGPALVTAAQVCGVRVAAGMGHSHLGVEHLFLGIVGDRDCAACQALSRVVDLDAAEAAVLDVMNTPGYRGEPGASGFDRVFLPAGMELDRPLVEAIIASLPEGATFGFNVENDRKWVHVTGPGDTREVLNAALTRMGRPPLS